MPSLREGKVSQPQWAPNSVEDSSVARTARPGSSAQVRDTESPILSVSCRSVDAEWGEARAAELAQPAQGKPLQVPAWEEADEQ